MGRDTPIKLVALANTSYTMSVLLFPKSFSESIDSILNHFWWKSKSIERTKHYLTTLEWSILCKPKDEGGLGFRKFCDFIVFGAGLIEVHVWKTGSGNFALVLLHDHIILFNIVESTVVGWKTMNIVIKCRSCEHFHVIKCKSCECVLS